MYNENMLIQAEILSEGGAKLLIRLHDGTELQGYSLGIEPALDEDCEELDYNILCFEPYGMKGTYIEIKNDEIEYVSKAV